MSEEIKEILEDVKRHLDYVEATKQSSIRDNEMKAMYDYITNLQEENEYSNHCNEELRKKITNLEYKIERLEEENTKLKELCDKYEEEHNNEFQCWKRDRKELLDKRDRINKAIDNLENPYFVDCEQQCKDAINILQGEQNE